MNRKFLAGLPLVLVSTLAMSSPLVVESVEVVSSTRANDTATRDAKRVTRDQGVELYLLVHARRGGKPVYLSDASSVRVSRKVIAPRPLSEAGLSSISWFKIEPAVENMSNTESGSFRFEEIPYRAVPFATGGRVTADVRPTLTPDRGKGLGTMRFSVSVRTADGRILTSPGATSRRGRGSGGLSPRVHRVSIRKDNTYLGYLSEMYGQPYIWASGGRLAKAHQSERLEGSDCADFMTYGRRRMGHKVPYTWSEGLRDYTRLEAAGSPGSDGVYRDSKGKALSFPAPGDLILFPRHVGAVVADRGVPGTLDTEDVLFHTLFASPTQEAIGKTSFASSAIEVRRWR